MTSSLQHTKAGRATLSVPSIPFSAIITVEVLVCCAALTGALIGISSASSNSNNALSLQTGRDSVYLLATNMQSRVSQSISLQIKEVSGAPMTVLAEMVKLIKLGLLDPLNGDEVIPYLYRTQVDNDLIAECYFGSNQGDDIHSNLIDILKSENVPPYSYELLIQDNNQAINQSICPHMCPQNLTSKVRYTFNISAPGNQYHPKIGALVSEKIFPTKLRPWFIQAAKPGVTGASWTEPYIFATIETNVGITACEPIFASNGSLLGVAAVDMSFSQLSTDLSAIPFTNNGFAFIFNSAGVFYGSSVKNESVSFNSYDQAGTLSVTLKDVHNITDWRMSTAVMAVYGSVKGNLANLAPTQTYIVEDLIFQHQLYHDQFGLSLIIVTGALQSDFTGSIVRAQQVLADNLAKSSNAMVGIGIGISLFFVLASIPVTYLLIGYPLKHLTNTMVQVAGFDFSALLKANKKKRSVIKELQLIEDSFWEMVMRFAEGIKANHGNRVVAGTVPPTQSGAISKPVTGPDVPSQAQ